MKESLQAYCHRCGRGELLAQWAGEQNGRLMPTDISFGSKRKIWWRCSKGHVWQSAVHVRISGNAGCPYCARRLPWPGESDLVTRAPQIAAQWHPDRNPEILPTQVLPGSNRQVWWKCEKGHEWQASVKSRVNGAGCPICANKTTVSGENDLASAYPALAKEWHPSQNGALTPKDVVPGTRRRVWWQCEKGHAWQAAVASRVEGAGCPVCAGKIILPGHNDLASRYPGIAAQWDSARNGGLSPKQVSPASNRKVWWQCERGHGWQAAVAARTAQNSGCPYCSGTQVLPGFNDLATVEPAIAAQWDKSLNGFLSPEMVTAGSHKRIWWRCGDGHVWKAPVYSRTGKARHGCPVCAGNVRRRSRFLEPEARAGD